MNKDLESQIINELNALTGGTIENIRQVRIFTREGHMNLLPQRAVAVRVMRSPEHKPNNDTRDKFRKDFIADCKAEEETGVESTGWVRNKFEKEVIGIGKNQYDTLITMIKQRMEDTKPKSNVSNMFAFTSLSRLCG